MAVGKVSTGFSRPYVALYSHNGTTVSYTSGRALARGVSVALDVEASDDNNFYADNQLAESAAGSFTGGTVSLEIDGLKKEARKLIYGLPEAGSDGFVSYGDAMSIPFVGVGYLARYMSDGVTTYIPQVLAKVKFNLPGQEHHTQEEEIDWNTQTIEGVIARADDDKHTWFWDSDTEYTSEAEAEAALKTKLGISG